MVCVQLLTPVQVARCIVQGWPYTPDTLAICSWVAAEDGDAGALAVLTAPSRPTPSAGGNWAGPPQNGFSTGDLGSRGSRGEERACHILCLCSTPLLAILTFTAYLLVAHVPATHECLACLHCCPSQASGQQQSFEAMRVCWC